MDISIESHAHRKLRRLKRYTPILLTELESESFIQNVPTGYGNVIGIYRNDIHNNIAFTTEGVVIFCEGDLQFVAYNRISHVIRENKNHIDEDEILLQLCSGFKATLPIEGKNLTHGTHDKYEVMMFLDSAIAAHRLRK